MIIHEKNTNMLSTLNSQGVIGDYSRKKHQYVVTPTGYTAYGKKLKIGVWIG